MSLPYPIGRIDVHNKRFRGYQRVFAKMIIVPAKLKRRIQMRPHGNKEKGTRQSGGSDRGNGLRENEGVIFALEQEQATTMASFAEKVFWSRLLVFHEK